jgi:acyl carrier protein
MSAVTPQQVRLFLGELLSEPLENAGLDPRALDDDLDLHASGVIDSLGLIEVIGEIEARFDLEIDFEELDPDQLTVVGPFCEFVAAQAAASAR